MVPGAQRFDALAAGGDTSCGFLAADRAWWCWGKNERGELGAGLDVLASAAPVQVAGGLNWTERLSVGRDHACGLVASGLAYCWG